MAERRRKRVDYVKKKKEYYKALKEEGLLNEERVSPLLETESTHSHNDKKLATEPSSDVSMHPERFARSSNDKC